MLFDGIKETNTEPQKEIDLFSLYVFIFSHFTPGDATRGNSFFQMSSYARANVRITNEKKQKENSHEGPTWSEMVKQNLNRPYPSSA